MTARSAKALEDKPLLCTNSEPGWMNDCECSKPARWIGLRHSGLRQPFCDECRRWGWDAAGVVSWERIPD